MNSVGTTYVLWLGCLLQLYGLQRLYNGKIFSGLLWMCTFGLLGVGQLIDLILIPKMVEEYNAKLRTSYGLAPGVVFSALPAVERVVSRDAIAPSNNYSEQLMVRLLKAAEARGGRLLLPQAVLDTGATFEDVELTLNEMVRRSYVEAIAQPTRGILLPEFKVSRDRLMVELLKAAVTQRGKLSVTQGVMATGANFAEVEATLQDMVKSGYVDISNDLETGVVVYEFREL
jgi:TM2 domain-containing membrane protein YozV